MSEDLDREQVAIVFAAAMEIVLRIDQDENDARKMSAAIPRDILNWGEAMMLVPAAMVLAAKLYPELLDPETLRAILHNARPALIN